LDYCYKYRLSSLSPGSLPNFLKNSKKRSNSGHSRNRHAKRSVFFTNWSVNSLILKWFWLQ